MLYLSTLRAQFSELECKARLTYITEKTQGKAGCPAGSRNRIGARDGRFLGNLMDKNIGDLPRAHSEGFARATSALARRWA